MEPMSAMESALSVTSGVPLVLDQLPTVYHVPLVKFFTTEDVGPLAPLLALLKME
jgi:hypothetical protein